MATSQKILIVEDDPIISNLTKMMLGHLGYMVVATASSGMEAISKVVANSPDFVLMDINLGTEFDGIDTATYVYHCFKTPVIFLTGNVDSAVIDRAKYAEPFGYLAKPFTKENLYSTLEIGFNTYNIGLSSGGIKKPDLRRMMHLNDPLVMVDKSGDVIFMNPCAEHISGRTQNEAFLKPLNEVFYFRQPASVKRCDHVQLMHCIHCGVATGRKQNVKLISRDKKVRDATIQVKSIRDKNGNFIGHFLQMHQVFANKTK